MNTIMRIIVTIMIVSLLAMSGCTRNPSASHEPVLPGFKISKSPLTIRVVDNSPRYSHLNDGITTGMNGLAALIHKEQNKNIFAGGGLNIEECETDPKAGPLQDLWNAPRVGPMKIEQVGEFSVKLSQKGAETSGLNIEILFTLGDSYVDQTITTWPDQDIKSSHTFWASYMNQVQNTSLYLHGTLEGQTSAPWLEATSPGHGSDGTVFYRTVDPYGKAWHEFLIDNPVLRQARFRNKQTIAGAKKAGFKPGKFKSFDNFLFGLVDEYVFLLIFRPQENTRFGFWTSASGGLAVRCPAWDYMIDSGPQRANERRSFHVRLVYKPFVDIEDILNEVRRFQNRSVDN